MATLSWTGSAPSIAQVNTWTFTGTWSSADVITVTIGSKAYTFTTGSATIATFFASLLAALQGLSSSLWPEFAEKTWGGTTPALTATANTAGKPFTCTISTNSALGTINGASSSTGTATTASSGPYDVSVAANYSTGVLPANGDTLIIDREGARLRYGLDQHTVTLAVRRITAQDVQIGLPEINADAVAYSEYRPTFWKIGVTSDYVNSRSGRLKLDYYTIQTTCTVDYTGKGVDQNIPALLINGTNASNAFNIFGGQVAFAFFGGNSCTVNTLKLDNAATVTCNYGCTLNTANNYGGALTVNTSGGVATALNHPQAGNAVTTILGTGGVAQLTAYGGTIDYQTSGTLAGNTVLGGNAVLTFDNDQRARTVSNAITVYSAQVVVTDQFLTCGTLTVNYQYCSPGRFGAGSKVAITRTPL